MSANVPPLFSALSYAPAAYLPLPVHAFVNPENWRGEDPVLFNPECWPSPIPARQSHELSARFYTTRLLTKVGTFLENTPIQREAQKPKPTGGGWLFDLYHLLRC